MSGIDISVIIPVYNDPEGLRDTLESLVDQDFDENYEILPVDNNSTDNTGEVIEEFERNHPNLVRGLEENEIQSSYAARNKGIEEARGDILVFTDADMWWDDNVLSVVSREFNEADVDYLGGRVNSVHSEENIFSKYENPFSNLDRKLYEQNYVPTAFLAVSSNLIKNIKFDSRLTTGGDEVFGKQSFKKGFNQKFCENINTYHPSRSSLSALIERKSRWEGKKIYQLKKFYPDLLDKDRHPLSPLNFLPALPWRVSNISEDWSDLNWREKTGFCFIYWILKLAKPYGYLNAWKSDRQS